MNFSPLALLPAKEHILSVLAGLISYRTRRFTRRLAGSLAFSTAAPLHCTLQFSCIKCLYVFHVSLPPCVFWLTTRITLVWVYIVMFVIIAYLLSTCKVANNSIFDFSKRRLKPKIIIKQKDSLFRPLTIC